MDTTDSAYGDKLIRLDTFDTAVAVDPRIASKMLV